MISLANRLAIIQQSASVLGLYYDNISADVYSKLFELSLVISITIKLTGNTERLSVMHECMLCPYEYGTIFTSIDLFQSNIHVCQFIHKIVVDHGYRFKV